MSADAGKDGRDMLALQARVSDLSARVTQLEAKVAGLSESPDHARALATLSDQIDAATPGKVPGYEMQKLEARKRLTAVE